MIRPWIHARSHRNNAGDDPSTPARDSLEHTTVFHNKKNQSAPSEVLPNTGSTEWESRSADHHTHSAPQNMAPIPAFAHPIQLTRSPM